MRELMHSGRLLAILVVLLLVALGSSSWLACGNGSEPPLQEPIEEGPPAFLPAVSASEHVLDSIRARYPSEWTVEIPEGTRLEEVSREMDSRLDLLPPADLEDRLPIPPWFRVFLRLSYPELPREGPLQYPESSRAELRWIVENPDSIGYPRPSMER